MEMYETRLAGAPVSAKINAAASKPGATNALPEMMPRNLDVHCHIQTPMPVENSASPSCHAGLSPARFLLFISSPIVTRRAVKDFTCERIYALTAAADERFYQSSGGRVRDRSEEHTSEL